ncbi:hypothetical protein, partial [Limosilactobacillus reuteri]|uniref:hypothetical protein n=1 Tax=Limosilactobacillus reuteri TaxID=1598 RepID=UPI003C12B813
SISRLEINFINNLKSGLRFLNQSKIVVRILLLENQKLIVNSQPLFSFNIIKFEPSKLDSFLYFNISNKFNWTVT